MSNEMNNQRSGSDRRNPSNSPPPPTSINGVTEMLPGLTTRCYTRASNEKATCFGPEAQDSSTPRPTELADRIHAVGYAERITNVALRIAHSTEQWAVQALLREGIDALGAESAVFITFERDNSDVSACRFMLACEPEWCRLYLASGLAARDPWLAYAANHSEPIASSALNTIEVSEQPSVELARRYGFASAVLIPAHSGSGHSRVSLLCLGSPVPGFFENESFAPFRISARILAMEMHEWWRARIRNELQAKARLTRDDIVLLRHQWQGHSSKQIATDMGMSESAVNSRFQRMIAKLAVANRRQAAQLAVDCGLLLN